ncbi:hypothetical protein GDO81_029097 [Engystomops pustulosus]|uniref:Uncharacterized protein n=1 Tax=Engystomops pustulosus TaxID=76066 RepID=A0AAV6YN59_ENGPU|nr:hypothetical protein GDO81_029097 [Engystomops pustulosus]
MWNIQNGHNLHRLQRVEEAEVTCLLPLRENTYLSVGWNRKIIVYDVTSAKKTLVPAGESWGGGHLHSEDILAADYCPSLGLLVTASYDGEIIVWNTDTQRVFVYLRRCPPGRRCAAPQASQMTARCTKESAQTPRPRTSGDCG